MKTQPLYLFRPVRSLGVGNRVTRRNQVSEWIVTEAVAQTKDGYAVVQRDGRVQRWSPGTVVRCRLEDDPILGRGTR